MSLAWAAPIAGSIVSGLLGANSSKKAAAQQFEYAKALQQQNIDWEKEQYQNKNQWAVADMKAAGLNPILAAGNTGSVSSAPGGAVSMADSKIDLATAYSNIRRTEAEAKHFKDSTDIEQQNADTNARNAVTNANSSDSLIKKNESDIRVAAENSAAMIAKILNDIKNSDIRTEAEVRYFDALGNSAQRNAESNYISAFANSSLSQKKMQDIDSAIRHREQDYRIRENDEAASSSLLKYRKDMPGSMRTYDYVRNAVRSVFPFF